MHLPSRGEAGLGKRLPAYVFPIFSQRVSWEDAVASGAWDVWLGKAGVYRLVR